jgi:glycosyltransferase involved in cell wall biosynthesis
MKISIVTISYNQGTFIEEAILSILSQDYQDFEYIIVDPGSTDGSQEVINCYLDKTSQIKTVFEPDLGPADGLNKGFRLASGDIYYVLNADDKLLPGTLEKVVNYFKKYPSVDVVSGHALVIDPDGKVLRKVYSDEFSILSYAYGSSIIIQPATFFRQSIYAKTHEFNVNNCSNWDGELFVDLCLAGAKFGLMNAFLGCYRIHEQSVTGSGKIDAMIRNYHTYIFRKITRRNYILILDSLIFIYFRLRQYVKNPYNLYERIRYGKIYKRAKT